MSSAVTIRPFGLVLTPARTGAPGGLTSYAARTASVTNELAYSVASVLCACTSNASARAAPGRTTRSMNASYRAWPVVPGASTFIRSTPGVKITRLP